MYLVLCHDLTLEVFDSLDVQGEIEGLDVEETVRDVCDERGQRYVVEWVTPNRHGRLLGLIPWAESGAYRLRPEGEPDPQLPHALVRQAIGLGSTRRFRSLDEVSAALRTARSK